MFINFHDGCLIATPWDFGFDEILSDVEFDQRICPGQTKTHREYPFKVLQFHSPRNLAEAVLKPCVLGSKHGIQFMVIHTISGIPIMG